MSRFFLLVVTMFCAQFSFAESLESREVNVALVINEIRDIDISRSHLNAVAEVLMSWDSNNSVAREPAPLNMPKTLSGADLEAFLTAQWTPEFYVTNAEAPRETIVRSASLYDDGRVEYFEKFRATLTVDAGIPSYPFGELDTQLEQRAYTHPAAELRFLPESFSLGHESGEESVVKGNWSAVGHRAEAVEAAGLRQGGKMLFSGIVYHTAITHDFLDIAQKIFIPLISLIFISLFINRFCSLRHSEMDNGDWRIGGQLTLLLTVFALRFSVSDEIPLTHYINLLDAVFISSSVIVVINLITSIFIIHLYQSGKDTAGQRAESLSQVALPGLTIVLTLWCLSFLGT